MPTVVTVPLGTSAAALQSMINAASPDTVFQLQAGTYVIDQPLVITQSGVSLIGAGRDQTVLSVSASLVSTPAIRVGHELHQPVIEDRIALTNPASKGDTSLALASGHGLAVGDFVMVSQQNTTEFFQEIGDTQWRKDKDLRILLAEVSEVNGNTITIDRPLTFDYDPAISEVQKRSIVQDNTLSGFTMTGPWGEADPGAFTNTAGQGHSMIMLGGTHDAQISNIGILNGISHGVTMAGSLDLTMTDFVMDGTHNKGAGGNGYAVFIRDVFDSVFSDLHIIDTRHSVLFGGWNTASGNQVHVSYTNRDINFHGGRDQNNSVVVDTMVRNPTEQGYMAYATFHNQGESYGAPTDPTTNTIEIRTLVASSKGDSVVAHREGSNLWLVGGNDTVETGAGDDYVNGGTGQDVIYASAGQDTIDGGSSSDTVIFSGVLADYTLTRDGDTLYVSNALGTTRITDVSDFIFADGLRSDTQLFALAAPEPNPTTPGDTTPPYHLQNGTGIGWNPTDPGEGTDTGTGGDGTDTTTGGDGTDTTTGSGTDTVSGSNVDWSPMPTDGLTLVQGDAGWQRETAATSILMGAELEAMQFAAGGDYDVVGNALDNNMIGNDNPNRMEGEAGNDRIFGRDGADTLLGGDGNDFLDGGFGDDALTGGFGDDTLEGANGNDTFLAGPGQDIINGENDTDTVLFTGALVDYAISENAGVFTVTGADGTTSVTNVEQFVFAGTTIAAPNLITTHTAAMAGQDTTTGGDGTDTTTGGDGTDTTTGGDGTDTTTGGDGTDTTTGGDGTDTTTGGNGTDTTTGGDNTDVIWLEQAPGDLPVLDGVAGTVDYGRLGVSYIMGPDLDHGRFRDEFDTDVWGNALNNDINGNDGANRIEGREGSDTLDGYRGDDTILGGQGNDTLLGGHGDDLLHGGAGDDRLDGEDGADAFVFASGGGNDRIRDFGDGADILWLAIDGVHSEAEALTYAVEDGRDVLFSFAGGETLLVDDVSLADLSGRILIL